MFQRLVLEEWHHVIPIVAFVATFSVFLYFTVRALRLKKPQITHLSSLPLEQDETDPQHPAHS